MKVLAYTSPARGHLFPLVPILDELCARGHAVSVRTLSSEVERMAERGFQAAAVADCIEAIEHDDYRGRTPPTRLRRGMATLGRRAEHELDDLRRAIADESPDSLLVDINCWGAAAVAEASGLPWAQWCPFPLPLPSRDVPPFGPGLRPANGALGRLRDRVLRPLTLGLIDRAVLPALEPVRRTAGVAPLGGAADMFTIAPLLLYMSAEPFEYSRSDLPPSIRPIGPCAWDPPAEPPDWLAEIERPLVLVSTSSEFQADDWIVTTALEALAGEDVKVIATLPANALPAQVPSNARVERFVPHAPILERAACAITHGGAGVTQKALAAGVPVCVVPFGRDQFEVARRVEVAGAGVRLPRQRLDAPRLREAVLTAMTMRPGAHRVAAGFAAAGGAPAGAATFEAMVASR